MQTSYGLNLKRALLLGTSVAAFGWTAAPAMAQDQGAQNSAETVIVTGTRVQGMTAADSAAPITVLGTDALKQGTGTQDLRSALGQTVPSFSAQRIGFDTANLTLSAALRGLSPNDTLVLVNGHRRHYTGNLHVLSGDFAAGSSGADLSLIPEAAIDHVEVLLDGAAAQYGTDAIAGVVNIILKKNSSGGQFLITGGEYDTHEGHKNGDQYDVSYNMGLPLFDKGYVNFTLEKQFGNFTQYGGCDERVCSPSGLTTDPTLLDFGSGLPLAVAQKMTNYPNINPILGNPEYNLTQAAVNAGYDFADNIHWYAFGTVSHRVGRSYENVRMPGKIIAAPGSNLPCSATNPDGYLTASSTPDGLNAVCTGPYAIAGAGAPGTPTAGINANHQIIFSGNAGSYTDPGELIMYPEGFQPLEGLKEDDYQYNTGFQLNVAGWDIDADIGYGKDIDNIFTWNSGNRSLFIDTHTSPSQFYDGSFIASQLTGTIDATHQYNVGLASPLTVAVGVEAREDGYAILGGDAASQYKEGGNSFPGFLSVTAGAHSRKNYAGYVELSAAPIEELTIDVAGRAEHYTDFGDTQIGKITARYDITPQWAIRGTISTGFRAPTIAEEFYNATNVSPTTVTVQLPADSAAAAILGLGQLKPEIGESYSAGIVAHPTDTLTASVDVYSIILGNRILASSTVKSTGGTITTPLVNTAIAATGRILDPTVTSIGVTAFLNGVNTKTQGVDLTVNYLTDLGDAGSINWTLAGNYNNTSVSSIAPVPAVLLASNPSATFNTVASLYNYVHSAPQEKVALTANWSLDQLGFTFRETYWGPQHNFTTPTGDPPYYYDPQAGVGLTDVEVRYNITEGLQFAAGGNNVFGIRTSKVPYAPNAYCTSSDPHDFCGNPADGGLIINSTATASFDPNGAYWYGRLTYNF
jgi:iron complex outermembrane recepter protein